MQSSKRKNYSKGGKVENTQNKAPLANFVSGLSDAQRDRHRSNFLYFLQSLVGQRVIVSIKDAGEISGLFYAATPFDAARDTEIALKMVKVKEQPVSVKPIVDGSTLILSVEDILSIEVLELDLQSSQGRNITGDLQTDGDIGTKLGSDRLQVLDGRNLDTVDSTWLAADTSASLEAPSSSAGHYSGSASWDQFEVNKRLYNVKSTFDENLYTKPLNRGEFTKEQIRSAERHAREIESSHSSNIHLQEERGQVMEREIDEEDLYSGVIRPAAAGSAGPTKGGRAAGAAGGSPGAAGVNSSSWRKAVVEGSGSSSTQSSPRGKAPVQSASAPSPSVSGNGKPAAAVAAAVPKANAAKGAAVIKTPPPGYYDDYVPVVAEKEADGSVKSGGSSSVPSAAEAAPSSGAISQPPRPESPTVPVLSFYGTPAANTAVSPPSAEPAAQTTASAPIAAQAEEQPPPKKSGLNVNAKEFVFKPKSAASTPLAAVAAPLTPSSGVFPVQSPPHSSGGSGGKYPPNRRHDLPGGAAPFPHDPYYHHSPMPMMSPPGPQAGGWRPEYEYMQPPPVLGGPIMQPAFYSPQMGYPMAPPDMYAPPIPGSFHPTAGIMPQPGGRGYMNNEYNRHGGRGGGGYGYNNPGGGRGGYGGYSSPGGYQAPLAGSSHFVAAGVASPAQQENPQKTRSRSNTQEAATLGSRPADPSRADGSL